MTPFEVGKPLPIPLMQPSGFEECEASFNTTFFDIVCWVPGNEKSLLPIWENSPLRYGLFTDGLLPFFIIDFPGNQWQLDAVLNIKKMQGKKKAPPKKTKDWLKAEDHVIHLFLCDMKTNVLLATRMISIDREIAGQIKNILKEQNERYADYLEVDSLVNQSFSRYTTADMMNGTKMIQL